jgi:DNA topoisomerase-3
MTTVILAEKPSVARELAAIVGAHTRHEGYLDGNGYQVTWAIGHLVGLAQPDEIDPAWKAWSRATLPMIPARIPLRVLDKTRGQYRIVERLLRARNTERIVAATDAGREGELIFRLIYELAQCSKPVARLWLSSMTPDAIRRAFNELAPSARYDGLAAAGRARSQADWLVGMNLSRALTLTHGRTFSVGRVQTPTLAMVVARDQAIRTFVPQPFLEVEATFESEKGRYTGIFYQPPTAGMRDERGRLRAFQHEQYRLPADGALAGEIATRASQGIARVAAIEQHTRRTPPPKLFDLTELQRESNRLYGLTAQETLDAAQDLYEQHKALSYPRTDCRYLSSSVAGTLPAIVRTIANLYPDRVAAHSGDMPGSRWVNDAKISDHHALIPTSHRPSGLAPDSAAARVYDLVCRRLLMIWHSELVEAVTRLVTEIRTSNAAPTGEPDLFVTQGTALEAHGWTVLDPRDRRSSDDSPEHGEARVPAGLTDLAAQRVIDVSVHGKSTRPPNAHTEATLLTAMEGAGRHIEDEALREAMRESGLGTPATRAATIEHLLARGYLTRSGKRISSTTEGQALVAAAPLLVKSAEMTGQWERRLRSMEQDASLFSAFMRDVERYVREIVQQESEKPATTRQPQEWRARTASRSSAKVRTRPSLRPVSKRRRAARE